MSELNAEAKVKQNNQQASYGKQQQTEEGKHFWRNLFARANEFSKKIALIDTFSYIALIVLLLIIIWIRPDLAMYCVQIVPYLTTTVVSLRLAYAGKASVENWKKISASVQTLDTSADFNTEAKDEENTQG